MVILSWSWLSILSLPWLFCHDHGYSLCHCHSYTLGWLDVAATICGGQPSGVRSQGHLQTGGGRNKFSWWGDLLHCIYHCLIKLGGLWWVEGVGVKGCILGLLRNLGASVTMKTAVFCVSVTMKIAVFCVSMTMKTAVCYVSVIMKTVVCCVSGPWFNEDWCALCRFCVQRHVTAWRSTDPWPGPGVCLGDGSSGRPGQRRQAHHPGSGGQLLISVTLYSHSNQLFAASLVTGHSGLCSQTADRKTLTSVTGHIFCGS